MRVLLTGGYGCIGSWIASNLVQRGDQVWIYDLKEDLTRMRQVMDDDQVCQVRFVQGDVTDLRGLTAALQVNEIAHVVHLAGLQVPICRADPLLGAKVNVLGTLAVFEAVKALHSQIKRLVYASSAAVFGTPESYGSGELPDDIPLKPTTHYGVFKCCNEANARIYFQDHGISSVGLRPWTVYGVGRDFGMTSEPTKAIKCVALGRRYHISYGGVQDLQFADDVAKTFIHSLEAPFEGARAYNLRGSVVDLAEFHRVLCSVAPEAADLVSFGDKQLPIAYDLSNKALQRDLGPMPHTPLEEGIRQTLERFRQLSKENRLDISDVAGL
jgi:nucleoside-diphosphate-sugar epimerase